MSTPLTAAARPSLLLLLGLLSFGAGCHVRGANAPDPIADLERDPAGVVRRVAELRGLPEKRPTQLIFQDEQAFIRDLESGGAARPTASDYRSVYSAFGFDLPSEAKGTSPRQVMHEQVIAFYDPDTHSVHVRRNAGTLKQTAEDVKGIVAHELGHSLQHQYFPIPPVEDMTDLDQRLASMALIEGDAMLTMVAYLADLGHINLNRALVESGKAVNRRDTERAAEGTADSVALMRSPGLMRERLIFPYTQGLTFLTAVHRSGGFQLVNQVYSAPPSTTEQVLHPEKYLAGEQAVPVAFPGVPQGWQLGLKGRMGELQTRVILENCMDKAIATRAATGWGGDQFMLIEKQGLALVWLSVWDTPQDAEEFELAARSLAQCWATKPGAALTSGVGSGELVRRNGNSVAMIRGMSPAEREELATASLELAFNAPAATPPLGAVALRPIPTEPKVHAPYVSENVYVNPRLGISLPLPPGYTYKLEEDELSLDAQSGVGSMHVGLSEWAVTQESLAHLYSEFESTLSRELGNGVKLSVEQNAEYPTTLGRGVTRTWLVRGTPVRIRLIVLPVCNSSGAIILSNVWSEKNALDMATWWVGGLRRISADTPPVCSYLNP
ncbi:MAG: hypothetical protein H6718_11815 [Polyangiaceae bacterium]|nr:hypothetical protein [Polyangiaceae bacterium]MCB9608905.1 hypothetical protein [Polyangiaceae bacterium]